jgi:hypothetical protein
VWDPGPATQRDSTKDPVLRCQADKLETRQGAPSLPLKLNVAEAEGKGFLVTDFDGLMA